jgi:glycosyltransferase involved in cell wall biosynthesis
MYNVEQWISENIDLIKKQTYPNFQVILIDDISSDKTITRTQKAINGDPRFKLIINQEKKYKTQNVVDGIAYAKPQEDDVIILLDGDDKFAHENVLSIIEKTYKTKSCWMTYGSYETSLAKRPKRCIPYDSKVILNNTFRSNPWLASHLKTFKFKLWQQLDMNIFQIKQKEINHVLWRTLLKGKFRHWYHWKNIKANDLHEPSGKYIKRIDDKAFSFPMLEISGDKAFFIEDILYIYRIDIIHEDGPIQNYGSNKNEKWHTRLIREVLINKNKYQRLEELQ